MRKPKPMKGLSGAERLVREIPSVQIGKRVYLVRISNGYRGSPARWLGWLDPNRQRIYLRRRLGWRSALATLIHECFHGMVDARGCYSWLNSLCEALKHQKLEIAIGQTVEEDIVGGLEMNFVGWVTNNPKLMGLIVKEWRLK